VREQARRPSDNRSRTKSWKVSNPDHLVWWI